LRTQKEDFGQHIYIDIAGDDNIYMDIAGDDDASSHDCEAPVTASQCCDGAFYTSAMGIFKEILAQADRLEDGHTIILTYSNMVKNA